MKKYILNFVLSLAGGMLVMSVAHAHHGWGGYKERVEGAFTITAVKLGNPHDRLVARTSRAESGFCSWRHRPGTGVSDLTRKASALEMLSRSSGNDIRSDSK